MSLIEIGKRYLKITGKGVLPSIIERGDKPIVAAILYCLELVFDSAFHPSHLIIF